MNPRSFFAMIAFALSLSFATATSADTSNCSTATAAKAKKPTKKAPKAPITAGEVTFYFASPSDPVTITATRVEYRPEMLPIKEATVLPETGNDAPVASVKNKKLIDDLRPSRITVATTVGE